jgi:hypothetical protein
MSPYNEFIKPVAAKHPLVKKEKIGTMIDLIINGYCLKNDRALAKMLNITPPAICKLRSGKTPFGPSIILAVHETFGIPVARIREMLKETNSLVIPAKN